MKRHSPFHKLMEYFAFQDHSDMNPCSFTEIQAVLATLTFTYLFPNFHCYRRINVFIRKKQFQYKSGFLHPEIF